MASPYNTSVPLCGTAEDSARLQPWGGGASTRFPLCRRPARSERTERSAHRESLPIPVSVV